MPTHKQSRFTKFWHNRYCHIAGKFIYLVKCQDFYKIGIASDLEARLNNLQCGNPYELQLVWAVKTAETEEIEQMMHKYFDAKRVFREWFRLSPADVTYIIQSSE